MDRNAKNNTSSFDYKDISSLRKFISEKGKITPRRISYISIKKQKITIADKNMIISILFLKI